MRYLLLLLPLGLLAQDGTSVTAPTTLSSDPGTCKAGQWYFNSTIPIHRACTVTNTWSNLGGATPGGTNGQIQINSSGLFGGITPGGDLSLSGSTFTVTKTGGVAFGAMATLTATASGGDLTGTWPTITVAKVGGVAFSSSNVASAPVIRDASGNFAGGTFTGNVTGNASGTAATITGQLAASNLTVLTTTQDVLYRNGSVLARLAIVPDGSCLGANAGVWTNLSCGGGGNTAWQANGSAVVTSGTFNAVPGFGMSAPLTNVGGVATFTLAVNTAVILSNANAEAGKPLYCVDASGITSYTCTMSAAAALTVYTTGQFFLFNPSATCSSSCALNIDSVGNKSIKKKDGTTDPGGVLVAGQAQFVWYDGTVFRLVNN